MKCLKLGFLTTNRRKTAFLLRGYFDECFTFIAILPFIFLTKFEVKTLNLRRDRMFFPQKRLSFSIKNKTVV